MKVWCWACGKKQFKIPRKIILKCTLVKCVMWMSGGLNNEIKTWCSFGNWEFSVYSCANILARTG